jgi:Uma2 family endonuclease
MSVALRPHTYQDLIDLPDDGKRRELLGGELIVSPAPRRRHQSASMRLTSILLKFIESTRIGYVYAHPVDLFVDQYNVAQPDLIAIRHSRLAIYRPEGVVVEPPDIVVEIISPSSQRIDRVGKMALYARFGVPEYWIVDPEERTLSMYALDGDIYTAMIPEAGGELISRAFPGLRVNPRTVFTGPDWDDVPEEGES